MRRANDKFIVAILGAVHLAIALPFAYLTNIWADEASSLYASEHGLMHALRTAAAEQRQAPLYFWALSLWRDVDGSIFFARLFSALASILTIAVVFYFVKRRLSSRAAVLTAAFIALHPYLIWASVEIRVYSWVIVLSTAIISSFFAAFIEREHASRSRLAIFAVVCVISLYTNYYLGFVIAGCGAVLICELRWRDLAKFAALMLIVSVAYIPAMIDLRNEFLHRSGVFMETLTITDALQTLWNDTITFLLPTEIFPPLDQTLASFIRSWLIRALVAGFAVAAAIRWRSLSRDTIRLGVIFAVIVGWMIAAYFLIGRDYILIRHASVMFVPLILLAASVLKDIFGTISLRSATFVAIAFGVLIFTSFVYSTFTLFPGFLKPGDWRRIAEVIRQEESPGQPIFVFPVYYKLSLPYYYRGANKIFPDSRYFTYYYEAEPGTVLAYREQTDFFISEIPANAQEIWLATGDMCQATDECVPLENYISEHYTVITDRHFYQERLRLLRKKDR